MERLTAVQKDERYSSVFGLMVKAREAHSALTKANVQNKDNAGTVSEEKVQELVANVRTADKAVADAVAGYTPDDVNLLLAYATRAIIFDALTPDGKGGMEWDVKMSRSLAHTLQSIPDSILNGGAKKLAYIRMHAVEAFIRLFSTLGLIPRYGVNDRSVRYGMSVLLKAIEEAKASGNRAQRDILIQISGDVTNRFPKNWLVEREERRPTQSPQPQTAAASIGEQVGQATTEAAQAVANETPQSDTPTRKTRGTRKSR